MSSIFLYCFMQYRLFQSRFSNKQENNRINKGTLRFLKEQILLKKSSSKGQLSQTRRTQMDEGKPGLLRQVVWSNSR